MGQTSSSRQVQVLRRQSVSAFLPSPKTEITSSGNDVKGHSNGLAYMQGWRAHMEDAHVMQTEIPGLDDWAFYCVLDGHAGEAVAHHCERHLLGSVLFEVLPVCDSVSATSEAMQRAFLRHDRELQRDFDVLKDRSGSTCTSMLMSPTHFIFCNLGDSRSLLCRQGRLAFATRDHKPSLVAERNRIRGAGGYVANCRVDGGLAISRAFGDFDYKMRSDLSALQQKVIAMPDVSIIERDFEQDDFILLACDGIFDVMSNAVAMRFVQAKLKKTANPRVVCEALVKRCLELGSRDNMSAMLVVFDKDYRPRVGVAKNETQEETISRIALSVAFNAVASGVSSIINGQSTSVRPRPAQGQPNPRGPRGIVLQNGSSLETATSTQDESDTGLGSVPELPEHDPSPSPETDGLVSKEDAIKQILSEAPLPRKPSSEEILLAMADDEDDEETFRDPNDGYIAVLPQEEASTDDVFEDEE